MKLIFGSYNQDWQKKVANIIRIIRIRISWQILDADIFVARTTSEKL